MFAFPTVFATVPGLARCGCCGGVYPGGGPVSLLFFDGCPHWRVADERLRQALA